MKNKIFTFVFSLLIITTTLTAQELLPLPLRQKEELKARSWVRETPFEQVTVKEIGNRISALSVNPKNSSEFIVLQKRRCMAYPKWRGNLPSTMLNLLHKYHSTGSRLAIGDFVGCDPLWRFYLYR